MCERDSFRVGFFIGNIAVALFFLLFVFVNIKAFFATGNISCIFLAAYETICIVFFLSRERAIKTSASLSDWAIAFSGTFLGVLLRPTFQSYVLIGNAVLIFGVILNMLSLLSLNRSFSIVPAERSIKTQGLYTLIRHPMYLGAILTLLGYLIVNPSFANGCIVVANAALLLVRINREESFLSRNDYYRTYLEKVRWRLIPFLY